MRHIRALVVCILAIGCAAPNTSARRQSMSTLRYASSAPIHARTGACESPALFSYDLYCDEQGHFSYDGAALALVKRPSHLQRIHADAASGESRSRQLIQELEYWFHQTGIALADRTATLECRVLPELQSDCRPPNWDFLEQFLGNTPECVRLREVLAEAYARRAHQLGVRNDVIVRSVNLLLAGSLASMVLARAGIVEARTAAQQTLVQEARAANGGTTLKPGPYARESIPAHRGKPTATEQRQVNELMKKHGCHTCGTKNPGTKSGNAVADHQPPQALDEPKAFYPQCIDCQRRQGGEVLQERLKRQQR